MSADASIPVRLNLSANDLAPQQIDQLTQQLWAHIQEAGIGPVRQADAGPAPIGSKSAGLAALGALIVSVLPSAIPRLLEILQSWISRSESLEIEIPVNGETIRIKASGSKSTLDEAVRVLQSQVRRARQSKTGK